MLELLWGRRGTGVVLNARALCTLLLSFCVYFPTNAACAGTQSENVRNKSALVVMHLYWYRCMAKRMHGKSLGLLLTFISRMF